MRYSDEEFTFNETVKDRKGSVHSARRKKNGSKSRQCSLPSDRLTPSQINRKHGEIKMFAMNMPNTWEDFISQSPDIQQEYIESLISRFDISIGKLISMFGVTHYIFTTHAVKMGYFEKIRDRFRTKPGAMPKENLECWINFLNKKKQQSEIHLKDTMAQKESVDKYLETLTNVVPEYEPVVDTPEPTENTNLIISNEFTCSGRVNLDKLIDEIKKQVGGNIVFGTVSIKIETTKR